MSGDARGSRARAGSLGVAREPDRPSLGRSPRDRGARRRRLRIAPASRARAPAGLLPRRGVPSRARPGRARSRAFRFLVRSARERVDSGNPRQAACLLAEGLAIWRGEALACLSGEPLTADVRAFLEEERLTAVEIEIDVRLELGQHHELLAELRRLTDLRPNRERLTARLMLALYRCGRQVDALELFRGRTASSPRRTRRRAGNRAEGAAAQHPRA